MSKPSSNPTALTRQDLQADISALLNLPPSYFKPLLPPSASSAPSTTAHPSNSGAAPLPSAISLLDDFSPSSQAVKGSTGQEARADDAQEDKAGTGNAGTKNEETGNEETGNEETGNEGTGNDTDKSQRLVEAYVRDMRELLGMDMRESDELGVRLDAMRERAAEVAEALAGVRL